LNYEFSNPVKINELFRPILQLLALRDVVNFKLLIDGIADLIFISFKKIDIDVTSSLNKDNIIFQVELNIEEAIEYLVFNNIVIMKKNSNDETLELTEIGKLHIQSEEPIEFYDNKRNLRYILDFLP